MKNELMIVDKIERQLKEKREPTIFPLTPTHRKELRQLRNANVGDLRDRLSNIETLKKEEYQNKYSKVIEKELEKYEKNCNILNDDWKNILEKINKLLSDRKKFEEDHEVNKLTLKTDYGDVVNLDKIKFSREYSLDRKQKSLDIAEEEFNKKYGANFKQVQKKIDAIVTHYEEAINFGDLEIVKQLYYMMKGADGFFEKISNLKI